VKAVSGARTLFLLYGDMQLAKAVSCGHYVPYVFAVEPPKGNQHCPRKNGYFAHPDPSICHLFYNCIDGEFTEVPCTPGLHFDEYQGTCVWPESSGRTGCSKAESEWRLDQWRALVNTVT